MRDSEGSTDFAPSVDWEAIERSPEFRELIRRKRAFVLPATIGYLTWYLGFIILAGYAKDFMGSSIVGGFTVGYGLALTQFVMVWGLGWLYLRKADREFDPLERRVIERAHAAHMIVEDVERPRVGERTITMTGPEVPA